MSKKGLIGVQMSTIAPNRMPKFDAYEVMGKLVDIGYRCAEISQVPMTKDNITGLRKAIDELGFQISSVSASVAPMTAGMPGEYLCNPDDFKKMVDDAHALDCDIMRIGMLPMTCMGSYEKAVDFSKQAEEYALKLKEYGIDLYYHNHHVEFIRYNGEFLLDIMRANAPHMGFELDTHWIYRGGVDPVSFIRKYTGSVRLLHLKDYRIGEPEMPEGGLDVTDMKSIMAFTAKFTGNVEFAELGQGTLDIDACIKAGLDAGSEYFLVEQDKTYGRDPFECLKTSRDHLIKLGYGSWF